MSKSACILIHDQCEEMEAVAPIDLLRRAGITVTVAATGSSLEVTGRSQLTLKADVTLDTVQDRVFDLLVISGGPGVAKLLTHSGVLNLVRQHAQAGRLLGAICAAPLVLHAAGLLDGKAHTAHPTTLETLPDALTGKAVVMDGTLITSRGAGTATAFALALIEQLLDAKTAADVAESICCEQAQ